MTTTTPAADAAAAASPPAAAARRWSIGGSLLWGLTFVLVGVLFLPTLLGYSRYAIVGGSMQGTYDRFSAVYEKPVAVDELEVGDVITYVPPPQSGITTYVTHRIIEVDVAEDGRPLFRTKGDANPVADPWEFSLDGDQQNVVRFAVPGLGWLLLQLADPSFRRLAIGIPAAFIAFGALVDLLGLERVVPRRRRSPAAA